ncbi:phosphonate metabolism protein/1,5-bisphosphokinase (PRPP-forming) PhnN [Acuticoccus sp. M5D2P5]|uniref:phosphonate metabolism protein/1,5-bisphosphokinase (PRPP-forming) PhnN n=1 Tax=Acuticoccus kalidii TaxID=2910977 RepID=UPI001F416558|nr:phosphonate metabolism protein/1,5-bisphosphokinase (PRPP-forming) PhnN [Acuticoccus kalidii]
MRGVLFLVVGPSGVGKDTLIDAARDHLTGDPDFLFARRVITRPADAGGEIHEAVDAAAFETAEAAGAFLVSWQAHGLSYGIRTDILDALDEGRNVVVNISRRMIGAFAAHVANLVVLSVTAPPEIVRARLEARGREDAADVAARLARTVPIDAGGARVIEIHNGGALEEGVARFEAALVGAAVLPLAVRHASLHMPGEALCLLHREARPVRVERLAETTLVEVTAGAASARARLVLTDDDRLVGRHDIGLSPDAFARLGVPDGTKALVQRSPSPRSRDVLRKKVAGDALSAGEIGRVVRDIVEGRYAPAEIAGFLVAASNALTIEEVVALTAVRAEFFDRFRWDGRIVVDKHSMGGVPGSRITMILVPIVAAHGLTIPKTSSRAITSAAGTADVMECLARVDLSPAELRHVVDATNGAIAWSGRISHSALDDVMNAINRPLGIRSAHLDVSSILSKKLAVGSTHVIVDIPVGPHAKTKTLEDGRALAALFETVGRGVGLDVRALVTDGRSPIGVGVGPALELADVCAVLAGAADAPTALREKALDFAGIVLEWDPAVQAGAGRARAAELLDSGAALDAFERIAAAQGVRAPVEPGVFSRTMVAPRSGRVDAIDGYALAGLARAAGAPGDKGAGARLRVAVGDGVAKGDPLLDVLASSRTGVDELGRLRVEEVFAIG